MCGVTGWVSFDSDLRARTYVIEAMTATMANRGPDGAGTWIRQHVALGHRRLAIIDLEGGTQPMISAAAGGEIALVYSGETYNFVTLRKELVALGHRFRTDSDTEVVLNGYLEWGESVAEHLNGMFAFALWDERHQKLVMIRDRLGVKPLYYYPTRDGVLFGSEPKAILANPQSERLVDADGLRELIACTRAPGWSLWQGMHEVEPGTVVTVDSAGIRTNRYWKLATAIHTDDGATTTERVRELLTGIVQRQLVADVPRCVLLSGGLDSSAITGLATASLAQQGERLRTFSVDFPGQADDFRPGEMRGTPDGPYIRDVVDLVGSQHRNKTIDPSALGDPAVRRAVVAARDMPAGFGDIDSSLYLLFESIREDSTVALSGEAADEVFGGYPMFHDDTVRNARNFPWNVHQTLVPDRTTLLSPSVRDALDVPGYIADQYSSAVSDIEYLDGESSFERSMRTLCYLFLTRLVRILLDRKDRISMAVGLEVRVPFCDHNLVEYVYNTPWRFKSSDGREKSLLRAAVKSLLPPSVAERRKSGYPSTRDPKYAAELQLQAREVLASNDDSVFAIIDRAWLLMAVDTPPDEMRRRTRSGIEWILDLHHWLDIYRPTLFGVANGSRLL